MKGDEPRPRVVAIIPARFDSSRFPGKPLANVRGLPMIAHVVRRVAAAGMIDAVLVATDDERIAEAAKSAGAEAVMTGRDHPTGTDRVAEVAERIEAEIVINVQGDQPVIDPASLDLLAEALVADPGLGAATLSVAIHDDDEWRRPDVVKVVTDEQGDALYFSRAPIPFDRESGGDRPAIGQKHVGVYGFRRDQLLAFTKWAPTPLEELEGLEQLRLLAHGVRIRVIPVEGDILSVDREEDIKRVEIGIICSEEI